MKGVELIYVIFFLDLPLKSAADRLIFFGELTPKLFSLPEKVVSSQLASLLLSRLVLLDPTAAEKFLPNMLMPSKGDNSIRNILCSKIKLINFS